MTGERFDDDRGIELSRRGLLQAVGATALGTGIASGTATADADDIDPPDGREWRQVWSDEFDGNSIDTDTWTFETGGGCGQNGELGTGCNWGNNEAQYYTDGDNAWVEDGALVIEAREEEAPNGVHEYTSARLKTSGKKSTQYGRIDIRATLPQGQGIWPALWMLGNDIGQQGWPDCGEIDIVELVGHEPATVHGTVHGPGYSGANGIGSGYTLGSGTFNEGPHTFSIVWDPDRIEWFVDGEQYHTVTRSQVEAAGNEWVYDDSFFFIFNVAVGGLWPGYPDETTTFPQQMRVEYIREYEAVESGGETPTLEPIGDSDSPPTDPDVDGLYEDLNANGRLDSDDVVQFFQHKDEAAVTDHLDKYDFNGNGRIDYDDIAQLFDEL